MPRWMMVFDVAAGVASIAGLVVTVFAWLRARGAENAARQAADAVRQANAAEDFERLHARAKDLAASVQRGQIDVACMCARDLVSGVGQAKERWIVRAESRKRLDRAAKKLAAVSVALSGRGTTLTPEELGQLVRFVNDVQAALSEETGKVLRALATEAD